MVKRFAAGDIFIILVLLSAAAVSFHYLAFSPAKKVKITLAGTPYGQWSLPVKPETLSIQNLMKVEMNPTGVRVIESCCERQICNHQGAISKAGQSIVCVPNRIVIELSGSDETTDAIVK
jgi:hypothetical protein